MQERVIDPTSGSLTPIHVSNIRYLDFEIVSDFVLMDFEFLFFLTAVQNNLR
jgi:hypothetical protein